MSKKGKSREPDDRVRGLLKEHLKQCNIVYCYYPEQYLALVESDLSDTQFKRKITKLYLQVTSNKGAVSSAGQQQSTHNR